MATNEPVVLAMITLALLLIAERRDGDAALQRAMRRVKCEIVPLLKLDGVTDE